MVLAFPHFFSTFTTRPSISSRSQNHRAKISHKKYRWFCSKRNQKTTKPKFSIKSVGGFAVSDTEKRPQRKKKVSVVLPLTKPIND